MKIAIIGTRGIPNHYGGFEQCAEYLAIGLVNKGFDVIVYNSHNHPYTHNEYKGVEIVHCFDPESKIGTAGQFIYDLNCILDVRSQDCDIILQLGYTSSSIWGWLLPKKAIVTTNMDGLEWMRSKYSNLTRKFLLYAEKLGVKYSDFLISDSIGIQEYLFSKYNKNSTYIAYGATLTYDPQYDLIQNYDVSAGQYNMLIARLEPENSIEIILDGVANASSTLPFLVIGKHTTGYGEFLKNKYEKYHNIRFIGGIYDITVLNSLRNFSRIYFHGHTVGGTNPSLLEAMASNSLICANDNGFNRHILNEDAIYFNNKFDVIKALLEVDKNEFRYKNMISNNRDKITKLYDWNIIVEQYAEHFKDIISTKRAHKL